MTRNTLFSRISDLFSSEKFLYIILALFFVFAWWKLIYYIDLKIAWGGFSPIGWVYKISYPEK